MAIKVIAQLPDVKLGKNPGKKFVMRPDLYVPITEKKVFQEAATHSGISAGVIKAAWDAAGEVIRTWATEGHSIGGCEGRAEEHLYPDYLSRRGRQRAEASDFGRLWRY